MTDDDTCIATKNDGDPCTYTAKYDDGKCGIHTDETDTGPGRPAEIDNHEDEILDGARKGMTLEGCARLAGVDESTLYRYLDRNDEFRKSLKRARAQGELKHLESVDDNGSQFILERSFGYVKTEKREVEMDADHSFDASEGVTAEFVTYERDDGDEDDA
jgi:hypothetical protein